MKKLLSITLAIALCLGLSACGGDSGSGGGGNVITEGLGSIGEPIPVGEKFTTTWKGSEDLEVTVLELVTGDDVWLYASNPDNVEPDEGNELVLIKMSIYLADGGGDTPILVTDNDFRTYNSDGTALADKTLAINEGLGLEARLLNGTGSEGYIARQIATGDESPLVLGNNAFFSLK